VHWSTGAAAFWLLCFGCCSFIHLVAPLTVHVRVMFGCSEVVQAFAFIDSDTAAYFTGASTPLMFLMTLSRQTVGSSCVLAAVPAYTSAASAMFLGAPVSSATAVGDGVHVLVSVGAHVFVVSRDGDVVDVGAVVADTDGALLSLTSMVLSSPCGSIGKRELTPTTA
jgi:hypothetical protein